MFRVFIDAYLRSRHWNVSRRQSIRFALDAMRRYRRMK